MSDATAPGYAAPATLDEALHLLGADPANTVIAGGTDLVPGVRAGDLSPAVLVDLRRLPLTFITVDEERVRLGARTTFTDVLNSAFLAEEFPALVAAAAEIGGPPIRNRATLGGNLVNASPAADGAPPLLAYDAAVVLAGPGGNREVPLTSFFAGPGRTVLEQGEILTEVRVPRPKGRTKSAFHKLGPRLAMAIAVVSVAVRIDVDQTGEVEQCRIALGAVAPTPIRVEEAERIIRASGTTAEAVAAAASSAAAACSPIDDIRGTTAHRRRMVEVLVGRLLTGVAEGLRSG